MPNTDEYIGVVISDVARLLRTEFDRRVRKLGITRSQWLVLTRLHRNPGASHSELADMMEVEKASAGRMIDRLETKGWVERRAQEGDRRVNRIYLTPEAERVHKRIWRVAEATVDDALAGLSGPEAAQLTKLLARIKGSLLAVVNGAAAPGAARTRSPAAPLSQILRRPGVPAAVVAAVASLAVMASVMNLTGYVVVQHRDHAQHLIFPIIGAHVLGMYALVLVIGPVIDRVGHTRALAAGARRFRHRARGASASRKPRRLPSRRAPSAPPR